MRRVDSNLSKWANNNKVFLVLILIILLGGFLRFYSLGVESLWYDEVLSIHEASVSIKEACISSNQPPLYFIILEGWMHLFGASETALRFPSAIFGIIAIFFTFLVGSNLFDKRAGLIAAFLSAISIFQISYSQEARGYLLLLALSLLSYLLFILIMKQNKKWHYPTYFLANLLLGYTHIFGLFIIVSQVAYMLLLHGRYRKQRLRFFIIQIISLFAFLPLIWLLGDRVVAVTQGELFWIYEPTITTVAVTFQKFSSKSFILLGIFLLIVFAGIFYIRKFSGNWIWRKPIESLKGISWNVKLAPAEDTIMLGLWLFLPVAIAFIISQSTYSIYTDRYLIGISPAFYLLIARGLNNLNRKIVFYAVLAIIVVFSGINLHSYYTHDQKEQWREVGELVEDKSELHDGIILGSSYCLPPFTYYYHKGLPVFTLPWNLEQDELENHIDNATQNISRVWLINRTGDRGQDTLDYMLNEYGYEAIILEKEFRGNIAVLLLSLPKP